MHVPDEPGWQPPNSEYPPPKAGEPPIHRAARLGDHDAIRQLAASSPCLETVFDLSLDPGARPWLTTPLMVAAGSGDGASVETVRLLLDLGADASRMVEGHSAASFACLGLGWNYRPGGDADRLRVLLDSGSPLPPIPGLANRLLCAAAGSGDAARVRLLLDRGLNPRGHFDPDAARRRAEETKAAMSHSAGDDPFAALPESVRAELAESMNEIQAEMAAQQSSAPYSFEIPLFCASESGSDDCLRLLLDSGADPLARDNSSRTALYAASSPEVMHLLLRAGVPLEDADAYEWSPLVAAVMDGPEALPRIRALLDAGANPNSTHDRGYTVFMSAAASMSRDPSVLDLLISSGANPHAVSELGYNAFHAAIDVSGEANAETSVRSVLGRLLDLGVDLEHRNQHGETPLARAIAEGTGLEVRVLCELGANPSATDVARTTTLLHQSVQGPGVHRPEKAEALLRAGVHPTTRDADGFTPLERTFACLCVGASDYQSAYLAFYHHHPVPPVPTEHSPSALDAYLDTALPPLRAALDALAARSLPPTDDEFESLSRADSLACAALLLAFEAWRS